MDHLFSQPTWLGRYRLTTRIATGGMAEVYVGRHISENGDFGPMVAVKRLLPHLISDASIVRMFLNEARITAQIHHDNVVRIHELGQVEGEPFIAMELLEGRTWADLRNRAAEDGRRMPVGIALSILTQACRGLDAAHKAKDEEGNPLALVHRDFTPDNIHVGVKGDVKVIDFGIARTKSWGSGTEPGTLKGKFFYMSPEMILAKPVDHRADIFAAGVMLYEQLCGRRPFTGNSIDEVVMKIAQGKPAPPSNFDPAVPRALEAVCLTALNRNPDSRFQSLADFVDAVEAIGGEAQLAPTSEVATYVGQLFPENRDARRQTLRRAREVDPSVPGGRSPISGTAPSAARPTEGEGATTLEPIPAHLLAPDQPPTTALPATPALAPKPASAKRRAQLPLVLSVLALIAVAVAAVLLLRKPDPTPAEAIAAAEQTTEAAERVSLLLPLGQNPEVTDEHLTRAAALLLELKQYEQTLELVDRWLERAPKSLEARLAEAEAATRTRKGKRAEAAISQAAQLAPNDPRPDVALARLRELQGEPGGALDAWTKAASKSPKSAWVARQGYWLSQLGRLDEANDVLTRALRKQSDAAVAAELGFVKFRKEQPDEALKLLRAAVKDKPTLLEAHYYLAAVLYQKGDVKGARAEYLEADRLGPSDARALSALCEMEQMQKSAELADAQKRIRERFPSEAEAMLTRCASAAPPAP